MGFGLSELGHPLPFLGAHEAQALSEAGGLIEQAAADRGKVLRLQVAGFEDGVNVGRDELARAGGDRGLP
jgi:hypothetical protein